MWRQGWCRSGGFGVYTRHDEDGEIISIISAWKADKKEKNLMKKVKVRDLIVSGADVLMTSR